MNQFACNLFIIVFILVTTYLLGHLLVHVFSEKLRETKPHSVVVHLHKKKGKNKYLIKAPIKKNSSKHLEQIETFLGNSKSNCPNCPNLLGKKPLRQVIRNPKNRYNKDNDKSKDKDRSMDKDKCMRTDNSKDKDSKDKDTNSKGKGKGTGKDKGTGKGKDKGKDNKNNKITKSKIKPIEGFSSGDRYLKRYRKNYQKSKCNIKTDSNVNYLAYNASSYF